MSQNLKEGVLQEFKLHGEDLREELSVDGETHPEKPACVSGLELRKDV